MAPKRSNEKDGKGKESQPPSGESTHRKCSNNDLMNLVSEGLLQEKSLVNCAVRPEVMGLCTYRSLNRLKR
jgi:hypothetical protein